MARELLMGAGTGGPAPTRFLLRSSADELGSDRRQLEASQGQGEGEVGQAHRRRSRHHCRETRSTGGKDPGVLRRRQGRSRASAQGLGRPPQRKTLERLRDAPSLKLSTKILYEKEATPMHNTVKRTAAVLASAVLALA